MSRALNGVCEFALMPGAHAGAFARHDFAERRQIAPERVRVFVINGDHVLLAKPAGAINNRFTMIHGHNRGSRASEETIRVDHVNEVGDGV